MISRQIQDYMWDSEVSKVRNPGNLGRPKGLGVYKIWELTSIHCPREPGELKAPNHSEGGAVEHFDIIH